MFHETISGVRMFDGSIILDCIFLDLVGEMVRLVCSDYPLNRTA